MSTLCLEVGDDGDHVGDEVMMTVRMVFGR